MCLCKACMNDNNIHFEDLQTVCMQLVDGDSDDNDNKTYDSTRIKVMCGANGQLGRRGQLVSLNMSELGLT